MATARPSGYPGRTASRTEHVNLDIAGIAQAERAEQQRRAEAYPRLLAVLKALVEFDAPYPILEDLRAHNATMDAARALIAEIEGE